MLTSIRSHKLIYLPDRFNIMTNHLLAYLFLFWAIYSWRYACKLP